RGPAAPARAEDPRCAAGSSNLRACLADLADLDGRRASRTNEGDDLRGQLDRARLAVHVDDPVARERFLRFGIRAVGGNGNAVLEADDLRLTGLGQALSVDELARLHDVLVELWHEVEHFLD